MSSASLLLVLVFGGQPIEDENEEEGRELFLLKLRAQKPVDTW
jgi:hypothetical protein